jgi:hypothetical protein
MDQLPQNTEGEMEIVSVAKAQTLDQSFLEKSVNDAANIKKLKPVMQLTAEYVELSKPGESFVGVYAGLTSINVADKETGELKEIEAARFITPDKKMILNAGWVLVNELKKIGIPLGAPLQVTYSHKKENTKIYTIALLG